MRTATYIITLEDQNQEQALEAALDSALGHIDDNLRWITCSPNEQYDHEYAFTDDHAWDQISQAVADAIYEIIAADAPEDSPPDADAWPPLPFEHWDLAHRRLLIQTAVERWHYLGPNGIDPTALEQDFRRGLISDLIPEPLQG